MATTLHQQLKQHYVRDLSNHEVDLDGYRIDAVTDDGSLIEVQCASLGAIRDKIRKLTRRHRVTVVKPLISRCRILKKARRNSTRVQSARFSPKRQQPADLFLDLVHFATVFPRTNLRLDVVEVEIEEIRVPPKRRTWRRKFSVQDRVLTSVGATHSLESAEDLWNLLPQAPESEFTTADLAEKCAIPRWLAQKAAWCFRTMELIQPVGKQGNSIIYVRGGQSQSEAA